MNPDLEKQLVNALFEANSVLSRVTQPRESRLVREALRVYNAYDVARGKQPKPEQAVGDGVVTLPPIVREVLEWYASAPTIWVGWNEAGWAEEEAAKASGHYTFIGEDDRGHNQYVPNHVRAEEALDALTEWQESLALPAVATPAEVTEDERDIEHEFPIGLKLGTARKFLTTKKRTGTWGWEAAHSQGKAYGYASRWNAIIGAVTAALAAQPSAVGVPVIPPEKSDEDIELGDTYVGDISAYEEQAYVEGWNACREAMLTAASEPRK